MNPFKDKDKLEILGSAEGSENSSKPLIKIPLFSSSISAGFGSIAEDHIEQQLDLNALMVKRPAATFFVRVDGDSMFGAGIQSGDILIVDRSLEPASGKIVIAIVNGEFTVKRLLIDKEGVFLMPENPAYQRLKITESVDFQLWGVVTFVIHKV
jgi:DNA polymerase V